MKMWKKKEKKKPVLMSLLLISDVTVCMFPVCASVFLCLCVFLSFGMQNFLFHLTFIDQLNRPKWFSFLFGWGFSLYIFFFFFRKNAYNKDIISKSALINIFKLDCQHDIFRIKSANSGLFWRYVSAPWINYNGNQ